MAISETKRTAEGSVLAPSVCEQDVSNWLLLEKVDSFCYFYDMLEADSGRDSEWQPGMLILGLKANFLGLGLECPGLGINNKANRHII